ncbi:MAG TPA: hypothetical protein HA257_09380 [Candidatus Methanoperedenaceae archaeon]|nr:hypothetical protein [Candidatus Methanoperedenaceae archaeon]
MALYFFECPCCGEHHVLNLAMVFEHNGNVDPEDWKAFLRVSEKVTPKITESETFRKMKESMA